MSDDKALVPVEQREVEFYGDEIPLVLVEITGNQMAYVPVRPICDHLGIDWPAQYRRINRDPVLADVCMSVAVTATDIDPESRRPRTSEMICLPLDFLNGWLFGINASRVKPEIRDALLRYQRECYRVLADAFLSPSRAATSTTAVALYQIREMGVAITQIADQLIVIEQRQMATESRLDNAAAFVGQMNKRLTTVERQLRSGRLTEEQASEVKKRVNLIARVMVEFDPSKSHYQSIYAALGEETGTTSYKNISPSAFEVAVKFLDDWVEALRRARKKEEEE
jgi:hypothetical protein